VTAAEITATGLKCGNTSFNNLQTVPYIHAIAVDRERSAELFSRYDNEVIVTVSKNATDRLSEESGKLGLPFITMIRSCPISSSSVCAEALPLPVSISERFLWR
jgi:hypothetical protein